MPRKNDSWGIEVGANALKAIRLVREGDDVKVVDYDVLPFKKVLTTPDINADDAIQVQLDQFLSRHEVAKSLVVVSIPGHMAFARFAKLPPVEPKKIPDIVKFEAVQQIPFPIGQVSWDYQVFQEEDNPDVEVGIFAITRERVLEFMNNYRQVGMEIHGLTLSPLAVYNAVAFDNDMEEDSDGVIIMDIGTSATDVIIIERGRLWLRTLAIGGNSFTEALVKSFKLSFPKAEKLKREAGTSKYARQIFQAMRPVFADLVQEMQRSLGFYQSLNRDADLSKVIGVGSTFKLPGLIKFLKQQLQLDVQRPDGFEKINVEGKQEADFAEHAVNLSTAYGLALQGVELEKVSANVLPVQITKARVWKAKQPWFAGAAAVMIAATGAAGYKLWSDQGTYKLSVDESKQKIESVKAMGNDLKQQWDSVNRVDPRQRIENLRRILDYRDIWPKLMNDLSMACMAFEPQKELLTTEYDKIAAIPRERRQQVVIESITAHYRLRTDANAKLDTSGKVTSRQSQEYVDIWGELEGAEEEGPPPDSGKVDDDPFGLSGPRKVTAVKAQKGPEFIITMTGHTPHADGPQQLEEKLIGWLNEHYIQENRPFRIVATREALTSVGRRVAAGEKKDRSSGNTGGDLTFSGGPQEEKKPGTLPLIAPPVGKKLVEDEDVEEGEDGGEFTEDVKLDALLPSRPLLEENVENDWQFTIQFAVQVLRPEEARQIQAERMRKEEEKKKGKLPPAPAPEPEKTGAIDGNKNSASS